MYRSVVVEDIEKSKENQENPIILHLAVKINKTTVFRHKVVTLMISTSIMRTRKIKKKYIIKEIMNTNTLSKNTQLKKRDFVIVT